jgi:hypothetical protein
MKTYNDSFRIAQATVNRYTQSFKVPSDVHNLLLELASRQGKDVNVFSRELLLLGISEHLQGDISLEDIPRVRLYKELARVRKLQEDIQALATIKDEVSQEEFHQYCLSLGIDPAEVDCVGLPNRKITKDERARSLLRVLFTDRPEGLPANRVLEISAREGFGENLTRKAATEMGIRFQPIETKEGRKYVWIPQEEL